MAPTVEAFQEDPYPAPTHEQIDAFYDQHHDAIVAASTAIPVLEFLD